MPCALMKQNKTNERWCVGYPTASHTIHLIRDDADQVGGKITIDYFYKHFLKC